MKKLLFLISISLMSQVFGVELSDYQKALNTTKRLEKIGKTSSSLVTEAAEELYQDRVNLELALKKVDAEFNEQHKNYTALRKAYINNRKNKNAAQVYYSELDEMTKALFVNSKNKNVKKTLFYEFFRETFSFGPDILS